MKLKRLVTSLSASFDDMVSKIENHEAVAEVTLQEIRIAAAKIRSQLNLTRQRIEHFQKRENSLQQDCDRWQLRAMQCGYDQDRERALRCVQALEQCEQQKKTLHQQIQENICLQNELIRHLNHVEQRLTELQLKRDSLSARSACNQVTRYVGKVLPDREPDTTFSRWEESVIADEYLLHPSCSENSAASLDTEFRKDEQNAHLEQRLAELMAKRQNPTGGPSDE
jgi:phage shock protein A